MFDEAIGVFKKDIMLAHQQAQGIVETEIIPEQIHRIEKVQLEAAYVKDPVLFNGINLIVKSFLGAGFKIVSEEPHIQKYMDDFVSKTNLITKVLNIIQDICIYGDAWLEVVYNFNNTRIIGLDRIDGKTMDVEKDIYGRPKLDAFGNPLRYFQIIPPGMTKRELVADDRGRFGIFFSTEKIAHFKLYTVGDSLNGIGLIEPLYLTSNQKLNIQQGYANAIYRLGFPLPVAKIGDERHEPNPDQIKHLTEKLKDLNALSVLVIPHYYDISFEVPKNIEKLGEHLTYFTEQEITGLGIPSPFVTGQGKDTNRSVIQFQSLMFERTIRLIQKVISDVFSEQVFKRMAQLEGWASLPKFKWMDVNVEDLDSKTQRLVKLAGAGLLLPDKTVRNDIRFREELPPEGKDVPPNQIQPNPNMSDNNDAISKELRNDVAELIERIDNLTDIQKKALMLHDYGKNQSKKKPT